MFKITLTGNNLKDKIHNDRGSCDRNDFLTKTIVETADFKEVASETISNNSKKLIKKLYDKPPVKKTYKSFSNDRTQNWWKFSRRNGHKLYATTDTIHR